MTDPPPRRRLSMKAQRQLDAYEQQMREQKLKAALTRSIGAHDPPIGGETYDAEKDGKRLGAQLVRVFEAMQDGSWHTLGDLAHLTGDPEASISARLRDFRKAPFGAHDVEGERMPGVDDRRGLWRYRLIVTKERR